MDRWNPMASPGDGIMETRKDETAKDRRSQRRRCCRAAVEWSYFNRRERFTGAMLNFSRGGAYIESDRELRIGATILLHTGRAVIACEKPEGCEPPAATLLAEIKWRRRPTGEDGPPRYGAGIRLHV
jgi:hypothetical protein